MGMDTYYVLGGGVLQIQDKNKHTQKYIKSRKFFLYYLCNKTAVFLFISNIGKPTSPTSYLVV